VIYSNFSFWPFFLSFSLLGLLLSSVYYFNTGSLVWLIFFFLSLIKFSFDWFSELVFDYDYGWFVDEVSFFRFGFLLFIASEVMFFFSFF